jgi:hypothetical protein
MGLTVFVLLLPVTVASYIRLRRNVGEKVKAPLIYTVRLDKLKRDMLAVHVELPGLLSMTRDFYLVTLEFLVEVVRQEQMGTDLLGRLGTLERELKANQQPTLADTERWRAAVDKLQQEVRTCDGDCDGTQPIN